MLFVLNKQFGDRRGREREKGVGIRGKGKWGEGSGRWARGRGFGERGRGRGKGARIRGMGGGWGKGQRGPGGIVWEYGGRG